MRKSTAALMAAATLLLLLLAAAYGESSDSEVETRRMFKDWMAKTEKSYGSIDEEEHRDAVFKEKYRRQLGLNVFADLTDEELRSWPTACALEPSHLDEWINILGLHEWIDILRRGLGFPARRA